MINIHSVETFGTHEGPGIRFVVFVQGCDFSCLYCHNPDSQALVGSQQLLADDLVEMIEKELPYFGEKGGVTISGGEPLLQAKEISELFKKLKSREIHTAIDTNGSILNKDVKELLKYTNLVLLDIKHIDPVWHEKITGFQVAEKTVPSIIFADYLHSQNIPFWIRYVLVPGYTDQIEYLNLTAHALSHYDNLERIEILPYHTMGEYKYNKLGIEYKLKGAKPPTVEEIQKAKQILEKSGKRVLVR